MNRLYELRVEKNLSQVDLANILQVSHRSIGRWEQGLNEPTMSYLIKLADYFDVTVDYLVGRTDDFGFVSGQNGTSLSADEHALVEAYRKLPEKRRDAILDTVITLAKVN